MLDHCQVELLCVRILKAQVAQLERTCQKSGSTVSTCSSGGDSCGSSGGGENGDSSNSSTRGGGGGGGSGKSGSSSSGGDKGSGDGSGSGTLAGPVSLSRIRLFGRTGVNPSLLNNEHIPRLLTLLQTIQNTYGFSGSTDHLDIMDMGTCSACENVRYGIYCRACQGFICLLCGGFFDEYMSAGCAPRPTLGPCVGCGHGNCRTCTDNDPRHAELRWCHKCKLPKCTHCFSFIVGSSDARHQYSSLEQERLDAVISQHMYAGSLAPDGDSTFAVAAPTQLGVWQSFTYTCDQCLTKPN